MNPVQTIKNNYADARFKGYVHRITVGEWLHCLVSPRHAETTWLRLDVETEEKYILLTKRVLIGLFVSLAFVAGVIYGQERAINHFKVQTQEPRAEQSELQTI